MLTRPLTLSDGADSGKALVMCPASPLLNQGEDEGSQTGALAPAAPSQNSASAFSSSPAPALHGASFSSPAPNCVTSPFTSTPPSCPSLFSSAGWSSSLPASNTPLPLSPCSSRHLSTISSASHAAAPPPPPTPPAPSLSSPASSACSNAPCVTLSAACSFPPLTYLPPPSGLPGVPPQPSSRPLVFSQPTLCHLAAASYIPPATSSASSSSFCSVSSSPFSSFSVVNTTSVPSYQSVRFSSFSSYPPVQLHLLQPPSLPPFPLQSQPHLVKSLSPSSFASSPSVPPPFSTAPSQPLLQHSFPAPPLPPPPAPVFPSPSSSVNATPSTTPSSSSLTASSLPPPAFAPAPPPPPCRTCSTLLPRLLSAHRLEVRRMLRGALVSISRRLDSLDRRNRRQMRKIMVKKNRKKKKKKEKEMQRGDEKPASCSPGLLGASSLGNHPNSKTIPSSRLSSDSEHSPSPSSSSSLSEQRRRRRRQLREEDDDSETDSKKSRRSHGRREIVLDREEEDKEEEEDTRRFVGRMVVSFQGRGGGGVGDAAEDRGAPIMLHNFNQKKYTGPTDQSGKSINDISWNNFRAPLALQSGRHGDQPGALDLVEGGWRFSDHTPAIQRQSSHADFHLWFGCSSSTPSSSSSSSCFRPAFMLRLSALTMKTVSESIKGGACEEPLRPLKDWTAPPSLGSDHCYMRTSLLSSTSSARRQLKQRVNHVSRSHHLPRRRLIPLPACPANGLSTVLATGQSGVGAEFLNANGERMKRVSQIRIRRGPPRETSLTPMGLPKIKRLKKKEFSLEEIYTNKNYKLPTSNRSLETIFEESHEKGDVLTIGFQKRRRLLLFPDFTQPRKRRKLPGGGLLLTALPRKRAAARRCHSGRPGNDASDVDVMLVERLSALEDFMTQQGLEV